MTPITARRLSQLDTTKRVYSRVYAIFDHLPKACRDAQRETGGWDKPSLRRCHGRVCNHQEKSQIPY